MQKLTVDFIAHQNVTSRVFAGDKFMLRQDRPAVWLQKVCLFVLKKLKAFSWDDMVSVEVRQIDQDKILDLVHQQINDISRCFNRRPGHIFIGTEDYVRLMGEARHTDYFQFRMVVNPYGTPESTMLYGLPVSVIPWMKGVLVVPAEVK